MQTQIVKSGNLLTEEGRLKHLGYSKQMLLEYNRKKISAPSWRIKEWDYYYIGNDDYGIALTVADNSYMGMISASLIDFRVPWQQTTSIITPFPMGRMAMPPSSKTGDVIFKNKKCTFSFTHKNSERHLKCEMKNFKNKKTLTCKIQLKDEPKDSLVIMTPYADDKKAFYYNQKISCMKASGEVTFDNKTYPFSPENSFGLLDWGRGVWTYSNTWYWGSASGYLNGETFGFNIGYGFGDTSAASENMLFYKGIGHKLEEVKFNIPYKNNKEDYMNNWTFTSSDNRFEMNFKPIIDRAACTNALLIKSDQHQVFGKFTGKATLDDGTVLQIKDLLGFAEKVANRW